MNKYAQVLLPLPFDKCFDYAIPEGKAYEAGDFVLVPFGRKQMYGIIWGTSNETEIKDKGKIKSIISSAKEEGFDITPISKELRDLIDWQASYCITEKGKVLSLVYSEKLFKKVKSRETRGQRSEVREVSNIKLTV